jgi:quercetin dioxygenase-like cupin family protein
MTAILLAKSFLFRSNAYRFGQDGAWDGQTFSVATLRIPTKSNPEETPMHKKSVAMFLSLLFILPTVGIERLVAQEATPIPSQSIEYFVAIPSAQTPGQTVYLVRFTLQPGAEIEAHSHPGTTILAVEQGALGYTLLEGTAHVIRSAGTAETAKTESVSVPGTDVILEAGDTIYYEADVIHTAWNASDAPAHVLATHILENGQPLSIPASTPEAFMDHKGTPSATTND